MCFLLQPSPKATSMDVVGLYEAKLFPDGPVGYGGLSRRRSSSELPPTPPALMTEVELRNDGSKVRSYASKLCSSEVSCTDLMSNLQVVTIRSRVSIQNKSGVALYLLLSVPRAGSRPFFSEEVVLAPDDVKYVLKLFTSHSPSTVANAANCLYVPQVHFCVSTRS